MPDGSSIEQPTITLSASESRNYAYDVTVVAPDGGFLYHYQLLSCLLTVTTEVKNAAGTPLASDAIYTLTNAAALNDDFNADSHGYWTYHTDETPLYADWDAMMSAGAATFDTSASLLNMDLLGNSDEDIIIYKTVTIADDRFLPLPFS